MNYLIIKHVVELGVEKLVDALAQLLLGYPEAIEQMAGHFVADLEHAVELVRVAARSVRVAIEKLNDGVINRSLAHKSVHVQLGKVGRI